MGNDLSRHGGADLAAVAATLPFNRHWTPLDVARNAGRFSLELVWNYPGRPYGARQSPAVVSATARSNATPTVPIDGRIPSKATVSPNCTLVSCDPASER